MENHPIPQDVTGFKFKLIGSITLKQFGYLLGAGVLATVVFLFPVSFIIRIPFILLLSAVGAGLAFVPIDGRPMDKMIIKFVKTIPAENQYVYRKKGVNLGAFLFLQPPKPAVAKTTASTSQSPQLVDTSYKRNLLLNDLRKSYKPDDQELAFVNNINSLFNANTSPIQPIATAPISFSQQTTSPKIAMQQNANFPANSTLNIQPLTSSVINQSLPPQPVSVTQPSSVQPQQKQNAFLENINTKQSMQPKQSAQQTSQPISPQASSPAPVQQSNPQLSTGFPTLPDVANVILGIVKDPRGKVLPNILVEVMDSNNIPVRAFKTNALGQFAAATPLQIGNYTILFEDPMKKNEFSQLQITLDGTIFQPIEIVSVDQREKLRQELFGGQPAVA